MSAYELGEVFGCLMLCLCPIGVLIAVAVLRGRRGGTPADTGGPGAGGGAWKPSTPSAPKDVPCGSCGGTGTTYCCNGYEYVNGQPRNHHLCGGTGRLRCAMCGGSGRRSY